MAPTKGWSTSAVLRSDVRGVQVPECPEGGKFSGNEVLAVGSWALKYGLSQCLLVWGEGVAKVKAADVES